MFPNLAAFWVLIPLLLGSMVAKRAKFLSITWLFLLNSLIFSIAILVVPLFWWTNYPVFHIYTVAEFTLLALLYRELLHSTFLRRIIQVALVLFVMYKVIDIFWITSLYQIDYSSVNVESALVLLLTLLYFYQLLQEKAVHRITFYPAFWINNANLFYFAGILLFSVSYLYGSGEDVLWCGYFVHDYLLLLRNLLLTLAFWFAYRQYARSGSV